MAMGFFFVAPRPTPSEPGGPSPKSQTKKSVQTQNNHSIFLAIFLPSKRMPRSNKSIYTKKSNKSQKFCKPRNKISKFENPTNKTQKKKKKKKKPKPKFGSQKHKKKKKKPNPIDCGSVTGEGWFMGVVEILVTDESFNLLVRCFIA